MIIGISAPIGSGKDTFCNFFQKHSKINFENKKFAYKLKQIVALLTGCNAEDLENEDFKNSYLPEVWNKEICRKFHADTEICSIKKYTYRDVLQILGTELMRDGFHLKVHINALFSDYKKINIGIEYGIDSETGNTFTIHNKFDYPNWLITDLRFKNEFESIKERQGLCIRVERYMTPENWLSSKYFNEIKFKKSAKDILEIEGIKPISKTSFVEFLDINKKSFLQDINDKNFLKLIHQSEIDLNEYVKQDKFDYIIKNETLFQFEKDIIKFVEKIEYAKRNN